MQNSNFFVLPTTSLKGYSENIQRTQAKLFYKYSCLSLINSFGGCSSSSPGFTVLQSPKDQRWCIPSKKLLCCTGSAYFKSQRISKLSHWFKSCDSFAEWVNFAYWWSYIGKGLQLMGRPFQFQSLYSIQDVFRETYFYECTDLSSWLYNLFDLSFPFDLLVLLPLIGFL